MGLERLTDSLQINNLRRSSKLDDPHEVEHALSVAQDHVRIAKALGMRSLFLLGPDQQEPILAIPDQWRTQISRFQQAHAHHTRENGMFMILENEDALTFVRLKNHALHRKQKSIEYFLPENDELPHLLGLIHNHPTPFPMSLLDIPCGIPRNSGSIRSLLSVATLPDGTYYLGIRTRHPLTDLNDIHNGQLYSNVGPLLSRAYELVEEFFYEALDEDYRETPDNITTYAKMEKILDGHGDVPAFHANYEQLVAIVAQRLGAAIYKGHVDSPTIVRVPTDHELINLHI